MATANPDAVLPELVLRRLLDAPRDQVFQAWTDPKQLAAWWGPKQFTNPACEVDLRPGGALRIVMRAPDGTEFPMGGTFQEIIPPERLVFISTAFDDAEGGPLLKVLNTITFEEREGRTALTVRAQVLHAAPGTAQALAGMEEGWSQSLDRLDDLTLEAAGQGPAAREFGAARILEAPRELVFRLWTEPGHVEKWWGPEGFRNTIHEMEVRPGGRWRLTMHGPDGTDYPNVITYLEVLPPHRLVYHHG
ncbi:MAG TPA: SRPBCC domain-containing protein, partial [Holophagaceae bacterium]|nr:SRPBCC domain-containing protein [Holophagaceae bacterium]